MNNEYRKKLMGISVGARIREGDCKNNLEWEIIKEGILRGKPKK